MCPESDEPASEGRSPEAWHTAQKRYYDERSHGYLSPEQGGPYAENLVERMWRLLEVDADARGLEVGCGAGRFTLPLLDRCASLDVADFSERQLRALSEELEARGVAGRCTRHLADVERLDEVLPAAEFDFVVGVFILHHLEDPGNTIARLFRLVRPGGRVVFVEPNRWSPLYLAQIALVRDLSFREERGMYELGSHRLRAMLEAAGFVGASVTRGGFFPPFVTNRFPKATAFERGIERLRVFDPVLPFLFVTGRRP